MAAMRCCKRRGRQRERVAGCIIHTGRSERCAHVPPPASVGLHFFFDFVGSDAVSAAETSSKIGMPHTPMRSGDIMIWRYGLVASSAFGEAKPHAMNIAHDDWQASSSATAFFVGRCDVRSAA